MLLPPAAPSVLVRARLSALSTLALGALVLVLALSACGGVAPPGATPADRCVPPVRYAKWRHHFSGGAIVSQLGDPAHVVADALAGRGQQLTISTKFAYGGISKDVQDEVVELWQYQAPCTWRPLGQLITDSDGRARFSVPASAFVGPGPHRVRAYLLGDLSYAEGKVWVVAPGTPTVLFDIDGTLTEDDAELLEELLGGEAEMLPGADAVARRWADLGYLPVYITGRPYLMRASTFAWLGEHRFPLGPVFTVDVLHEVLPNEDAVGVFKLRTLLALIGSGLRFHRAYGNASTDVCAYARAGIATERTFIVGSRPGCEPYAAPNPLRSYVDHLPTITEEQRLPPIRNW